MKNLEMNEMEVLQGGGCGASTGFALAGLFILAAAGGPFTWWLAAGIAVDAVGLAYSCGTATEW